MARFTLYLSDMLISLPSKLHSICREETGQGIELSALWCFRRNSPFQTFQKLTIGNPKSWHSSGLLESSVCTCSSPHLPSTSDWCYFLSHLAAQHCHLLELPQFSDTLHLKFLFFLSCPFIMSPPHKVIKKCCLLLLQSTCGQHWLTQSAIRAAVSSVTEIVEQQGIHLPGNTEEAQGKALKGLLGCCRCHNSLVIWILLLSNLGIVNMWV